MQWEQTKREEWGRSIQQVAFITDIDFGHHIIKISNHRKQVIYLAIFAGGEDQGFCIEICCRECGNQAKVDVAGIAGMGF
ncbi:hypothetical protein D3C85_1312670 [compost metagenome]